MTLTTIKNGIVIDCMLSSNTNKLLYPCKINNNTMEGFTHLAKIYNIKCYYNENTYAIKGTNKFNDVLIDFFLWIETTFPINDSFKIEIIEPL